MSAPVLSAAHKRALNNLPKNVPQLSRVHAGGEQVQLGDLLEAVLTSLGTLVDDEVPLTVTPAELNLLDGLTSSAAELNILDGVTATGAEINAFCDQSLGVQAIAAAGAITADGTINRVTLSGGAYAITLAVPGAAAVGKFLCIEYRGGDTDIVTLALTNVIGGTAGSQASFNADREGLLLYGLADKWVIVKEFGGVTMT